jgi:hypothetical protein
MWLLGAAVSCAVTVAPHPPLTETGLVVRVTGDDRSQREVVQFAVAEIDTIWHDDGFWAMVAARWWLPSVTGVPMPGAAVRDRLRAVRPAEREYHIANIGWSHVHIRGRTTATTGGCTTTTIDRLHTASLSYLMNTIAHENTHSVGVRGEVTGCADAASLFTDSDYGEETTPWLVSYGVGDLAECYRINSGDRARTLTCFDGQIDGEPADRRRQACCATEHLGEHLSDIRKQSNLCVAVACSP